MVNSTLVTCLSKFLITKTNQIFYYTRCITPKPVTTLRGPSSRHLEMGKTASFEELLRRWQAVVITVSDFTGPRFEPQTSSSGEERVTSRPTLLILFDEILTT